MIKNHIRNSLLGYFRGNAYFCKWTLWQIHVYIKKRDRYERTEEIDSRVGEACAAGGG